MLNKIVPKDPDFEKSINDLGFYMTELLTEQQLADLKALYAVRAAQKEVAAATAGNFYFDQETNRAIEKIIAPVLQAHFSNYDCYVCAFSMFGPESQETLSLCRDWSLTDERKDSSLNIWIPFDMSYPNNGGVAVVPGSHQFKKSYRSASFGNSILEMPSASEPFITDVIIPPLSALCYEGSLLHGHYPNQSENEQAGVLISLVPHKAGTFYFHLNNGQTEKYSIRREQFINSLPNLLQGDVPAEFESLESFPFTDQKQTSVSAASLLKDIRKKFWGDEKYFHANQLHLLKDVELRKKMYEKGYVVFDFVDEATVATLKETYMKRFLKPVTDTGRFTTMENTGPETRLEIHHYILDKINASLHRFFADYTIPIASYFTKYAQSKGDLDWHTDASLLLNAHLEPHYAIWCPLIEVNAENGALCVVDKTHKLPHRIFLNGVAWAYNPLAEEFEKTGKAISLKAGQAVLFDIRLVHNATPNISDQDRICFSLRMTHKKTRYYHFEPGEKDGDAIHVYREQQDIYLQHTWNTPQMIPKKADYIGEMYNPSVAVETA